jgi:hypothetical protein
MPPCGYRPPAVESIRWFLSDNLDYFIELHGSEGVTVEEALVAEAAEISKIMRGERGGRWAKIVVLLNAEFYSQLREKRPARWDDVKAIGELIIDDLVSELTSLTPALEQ